MVNVLNTPIYKEVSKIYNHIMRKVRYDYWADYIYSISSHHIGAKPWVLELASGNCHLAHYLSAYYSNYIATDLSLAMLNYGKKVNVNKVCCDMRMIPFKNKFSLTLIMKMVSFFMMINQEVAHHVQPAN